MSRRVAPRSLLAAIAVAAAVAMVSGCGDDRSTVATKPALHEMKQSAPAEPKPAGPARKWPFGGSSGSTAAETAPAGNLLVRNYYMVLDASGSMGNRACSGDLTKMEAAKNALLTFAQGFPADANLGLVVFDRAGVNEALPIGPGNRDQFGALVAAVRPNGGTPLKSAIELAYRGLTGQARKQFGYGEYHLVIVTDGEADTGQDPGPIVNRMLQESPVVIHTIGFCIGTNHSLNQPGRTLYQAADNPEQLRQQLSDVLAEAPAFSVTKFSKQ
jgi:uncharacterized protein YegL